jgi:hypothetical protein
MIALASLAAGNPATVDVCWWDDVSSLADKANRRSADPARAWFRFADVILEVDTTYEPLLAELRDTYGDCEVSAAVAHNVVRIGCSARIMHERSRVALRFQTAGAIPHLSDIALRVIHPRAELRHFFLCEVDRPGWKCIADSRDRRAPLLLADAAVALVDVRVAPPEFLVNFVVGIAQLTQPSIAFVHAGSVRIDERGTLLVGGSGKGKSTTTAALASRGNALLGDETVGLRAEPREIIAFRRTLKLRPGPSATAVSERLKSVQHSMRMDAHGVACAWVRPATLFPGATPSSAPLDDVFFLRRFSSHAAVTPFVPTLDNLEEIQALTMTLSAIASWPFSAAHRLIRFARVIDLFAKCRCYLLDLGTPDETAALIERTVRSHDIKRP